MVPLKPLSIFTLKHSLNSLQAFYKQNMFVEKLSAINEFLRQARIAAIESLTSRPYQASWGHQAEILKTHLEF